MLDLTNLMKVFNKSWSRYKYLFVIILVGIIILALPGENEKNKASKNPAESDEFNLREFEEQIEDILSSGDGVGRVKVLISLKSGMEKVYAEEKKSNTRHQENGDDTDINEDRDRKPSIVSDGNGGEEPLIVKRVYPEFLGAVVSCDGAEKPSVQMYITDVIYSLTGITYDRITVIKMKN